MIDPYGLLVAPFVEFAFMRRALVASMALSLGCAPVGVFLILRRMSLVGDALSHAILPGAAIAFLFAGLSLGAMAIGGFVAGVLTALGAGALSRLTPLREDATFAAFYLIALAAGVMMVSVGGSGVDLLHVLFGSVLAVDDTALILVASVASVSMLAVAALYRGFVIESFDREFLRVGGDQRTPGRRHQDLMTLADIAHIRRWLVDDVRRISAGTHQQAACTAAHTEDSLRICDFLVNQISRDIDEIGERIFFLQKFAVLVPMAPHLLPAANMSDGVNKTAIDQR